MAFSPTDNGCTDEERAAALCLISGLSKIILSNEKETPFWGLLFYILPPPKARFKRKANA